MKGQWGLILGLVFALIIAIFSVINVDPVTVNYLFGHAKWPLILVILGSVLMGALIVGSLGLVRVYKLQRTVNRLTKRLHEYTELESNQEMANTTEALDREIDARVDQKNDSQ
ncbi:hypothetical protein GCM10011391_22130 [Pullulanibacillus camelliae]|uniref:Lipopolysaccharide assembly protein A domain-containing protein n=1 Tax=Pullulanibacillus camelliae TaxID=1707096 RepID=A0A8J3DW15_9BACL|nr:lipopolysaccharide assembly LapA domain-containing protein [Pullulanibacillus camelliae]GGE42893.1 hypothetical protein GCM10011391_22130 [Pullulanibacillus camelliae]